MLLVEQDTIGIQSIEKMLAHYMLQYLKTYVNNEYRPVVFRAVFVSRLEDLSNVRIFFSIGREDDIFLNIPSCRKVANF